MKNYIPHFFIITLLLILSSCKSQQNFNYMKNIEEVAVQAATQNQNNTIQVGDQLIIMVSAKDMDVVRPFNQNYASSQIVMQNSTAGGNTPNAGQQVITGPTYIVDENGDIDFPVIGNINTSNKTITQLKDEVKKELSNYIINPSVNIRLMNFKVTVVGEVNRQGDYIVQNGHATILNALGMAGDLSMYGRRDNVLVIRNEDGVITKQRIDLTDANFINSPYYNLKQGDVIYVSANETRQKASRLDPNAGIYISVASIVVTILALIFKN